MEPFGHQGEGGFPESLNEVFLLSISCDQDGFNFFLNGEAMLDTYPHVIPVEYFLEHLRIKNHQSLQIFHVGFGPEGGS